jgi:hypothetical protein
VTTPCLIIALFCAAVCALMLCIIIHGGKGAPGFLAPNSERDNFDNLAGAEKSRLVAGSPERQPVADDSGYLSASCPTNLAPLSKVRRETSI